jgi:hypothetical protein
MLPMQNSAKKEKKIRFMTRPPFLQCYLQLDFRAQRVIAVTSSSWQLDYPAIAPALDAIAFRQACKTSNSS